MLNLVGTEVTRTFVPEPAYAVQLATGALGLAGPVDDAAHDGALHGDLDGLGELTLERWVETCSTTPARMFGLDKKGVIEPGADADILVWDPNGHTKIGIDDKHHMNMDHSAYEGFEVDGKVDTVLSRGTVVVENDEFIGRPGHGRYVKRGLSTYLN